MSTINIRQTLQRTLLRCPKKYEYAYVQNLAPKEKNKNFSFGTVIHKFLEEYYSCIKEKKNRKESFQRAFKVMEVVMMREFTGDKEDQELSELAIGVAKHYHEWATIHDNFEVLGVEVPVNVDLPSGRKYNGTIDLIVQIGGKVWLVDHKTANRISTEHIETDIQVSNYMWAMEKLGIPVEGFIYNSIRKALPEKPRILKNGTLSKAANKNVTYDTYMQAIVENKLDPEEYNNILERLENLENPFFNRESTTRSKSNLKEAGMEIQKIEYLTEVMMKTNTFPRNITRDCSWDCPFYQLCKADMEGSDTEHLLTDKYKVVID